MKKSIVIIMLSALTLGSCGTYTADGAMTGGMFGAMIGSAIGGLSGGWRGSDLGQIVGMAGGAAVGAAIGAQADKEEQARIEQYRRERASRQASNTNSNNDIIDFEGKADDIYIIQKVNDKSTSCFIICRNFNRILSARWFEPHFSYPYAIFN